MLFVFDGDMYSSFLLLVRLLLGPGIEETRGEAIRGGLSWPPILALVLPAFVYFIFCLRSTWVAH